LSHLFEVFVIALVLALSFRRAVFLLASLRAARSLPLPQTPPRVTVLVPAWNESAFAERLLQAFAQLSYPMDKCSFVLVCDGCTDATPVLFRSWADQRGDAVVVELPEHAGKAAALNAGLRMAQADIVVVLDADLRPAPEFVSELVRPFADGKVGAAAAFLRPANADDSIVSRYAGVTSLVHQLVTSAGTDRLGLNPPTLGASAFRRTALDQIGGFPAAPLGVDVAASTALIHRGWRTRFVADAVADNTVAADLGAYWRQHLRWARATLRVSAAGPRRSLASWPQRVEMSISSLGYADRLVFALALAGAVAGSVPVWAPLLYLAVPGLEIVTALHKAGFRRQMPRFLWAILAFFVVDLAGSAAAVFAQLARRPYRWDSLRVSRRSR
jgi:cellulose synthase/poly-beta-1,6-N-acetylglucosamine synthase-like glycosyltransferase